MGHGHDHGPGHDHGRGPGHGRRGLRRLVGSLFDAHSHTSAADPALEASAEGIRAVEVSLAGLLLTAALQVVVFGLSGSIALLADTVHNGADALTAVPLWVAFALGRRRPTRRYTYGYGRAEDLAGIVIVAAIALSSGLALWESVSRLLHPRPVPYLPWVALAGLVGFAGNELVALYRVRVGRRIGSAALVADGLHARSDGLTSLAVVVGALGVAAGWPQADPVVGIGISVAILWILRGAARDVYRRLMDSVDPELVDEIERVLAEVPGVEQVEQVRVRWIGHRLRAEVGVVCDRDLSLVRAHAVAVEAHHRLLHRIPRLAEALVHVSPCSHDGSDPHLAIAHHFPANG
ncbi:MAG TPA: cation diffusion facilitator family transporter [Candidatus Dormibacteraeota bacterium]|nr:cation diffusion facilitator family transporter [Candidatus Dormibacteraeota bacterium]